jgi:hypothetical protein
LLANAFFGSLGVSPPDLDMHGHLDFGHWARGRGGVYVAKVQCLLG